MKIRKYKHKIYIKKGVEYYKNPITGKPWVRAYPEEEVRQDVLKTLTNKYRYPIEQIFSEFPIPIDDRMSRFLRSDVLVCLPSRAVFKNGERLFLQTYIIIECKRRDVDLNQGHLEQGLTYCKETGAFYLVLTNGGQTLAFVIQDEDHYYEIDDIPTFEEAKKPANILSRQMMVFILKNHKKCYHYTRSFIGNIFLENCNNRNIQASISHTKERRETVWV